MCQFRNIRYYRIQTVSIFLIGFIKGLSQVISSFDIFLDTFSQESESDDFCIKIYDAVHLEDGKILRTTGEFYGKEWFSNVAVTSVKDQGQYNSDDGAWYGKVSEILRLAKYFSI